MSGQPRPECVVVRSVDRSNYGSVDAVAVIARTDPNVQESVVAAPELDTLEHLRTRPSP